YVVLIRLVSLLAFTQHSKDHNAGVKKALQEQSRLIEECQQSPAPPSASAPATPQPGDCASIRVTAEDKRWRVTDTLDAVKGIVVLGALLCFVLGASAGGAEWAAGTLQALRFWEPRRL